MKICGNRRHEDVTMAREADAVGFVVESPKSKRNLDVTEASELARRAPPFQSVVAVTATTDEKRLRRILHVVRPDALQLPAAVDGLVLADIQVEFPDVKYLVSLKPEEYDPMYDAADALVLDATTDEFYGGTGRRVDTQLAKNVVAATRSRVILAGGLTPENVADAVREVQPFAVDVATGIETDGKHDATKVAAFIRNAKEASR
ncbi:MAG: phosphoribosylanthranilate isomerase [Thermoplasmatota archaeon]